MLIDGVDVNLRTHELKQCPLYVAARSGQNHAIVKFLIDRGADVNAEDRGRSRPLRIGCLHNVIRVGLLLDSGADIDAVGYYGTALRDAYWVEDDGSVQLLVARGAKVNLGDSARNGVMDFPLVIACLRGHVVTVQHLINHGADINVVDSTYGTALTAACSTGREAIVRLLLENGADIEGTEKIGDPTALIAACSGGHDSIVRLLLDLGAKASEPLIAPILYNFSNGAFEISPLHIAAWNDSVVITQLLIDYGADINTQPDKIGTPLVLAAHQGNYSMVKFLLDNGADVLATCDYFVNALVAAAKDRHEKVIQLLLSHGARFCKSDWEGLRDWESEGYLLRLDSIYEKVKGKDIQATIEALLVARGITSLYAEEIFDTLEYL